MAPVQATNDLPDVPLLPLGSQGMKSSKQGFGCMGMSFGAGKNMSDEQHMDTIRRAIELGVTMLDTMDLYGPFTNEVLVGKAIQGLREKVQVCTKYGPVTQDGKIVGHCATPEYTRKACLGAMERLGVDYLDLFYIRSPDPNTPVEETFGELKKLVEEGKVKHLGISEFTGDEIRRAHAVHPITACELEWSLWSRDVEEDVIPTCRELGIGIVPYSPLGRGFFTGSITNIQDLPADDFRRISPRFLELEANHKFYLNLKALADKKGVTPGQLALAWVHNQGDDVFPIPGTTSISHLEENVGALKVKLSKEEMEELAAAVPHLEVKGDRYPAAVMKMSYNARVKPKEVAQ